MAVDERSRLQLADAAKRAFGDDAGITLMELLPAVGWADVATKQDLVLLKQDLIGLEQHFEARIETLELRIEARFERGFRQIMVTMASLMVAGFAATTTALIALR
jgi:hypothetical protein